MAGKLISLLGNNFNFGTIFSNSLITFRNGVKIFKNIFRLFEVPSMFNKHGVIKKPNQLNKIYIYEI
ncbi:MAG: hypothetical protein ED556_12605 [Winogradskyella sp.]|nr:MAG: hypothetical protein ED556_12605 [Winogradskyella sp.]